MINNLNWKKGLQPNAPAACKKLPSVNYFLQTGPGTVCTKMNRMIISSRPILILKRNCDFWIIKEDCNWSFHCTHILRPYKRHKKTEHFGFDLEQFLTNQSNYFFFLKLSICLVFPGKSGLKLHPHFMHLWLPCF